MRKRVLRLLAITFIFVLVGPPVGAMTFALVTALIGMGGKPEAGSLFVVAAFAMIYAVPLSYLFGIGPAFLAGGLVGLWLAFFGPMRWFAAVIAGLVVGLLMQLMTGQAMLAQTGDATLPPVLAIICAVATMACWAIVRGWHLPRLVRAGATS
jgi:hypothetical protein